MQIGRTNKLNKNSGMLIAVEGIDGSGKTSVAGMLIKKITNLNIECIEIPMPSPWYRNYEFVANANQRSSGEVMCEIGMAMFLATDKIETIHSKIIPLLNDGKIVICSRYFYSSYAHWIARDTINNEWHKKLYEYALIPDIKWLIDVEANVAYERILKRAKSRPDFYEENLPYMKKVRAAYLKVAKENNFRIINNTYISKEKFQNEIDKLFKTEVMQKMKMKKTRKIA